jgi:nitroreductase
MRTTAFVSSLALVLCAATVTAQELAPIVLPPPQTEGGKPLMQALRLRASSREFAPEPLPAQTLSNLLWAAWGINRPDSGKRTAPSARNWQEIDVYAVLERGVFLYDAVAHRLKPVAAGDFRAATGRQEFAREAPLTLVLVADRARMKDAPADQVEAYASADAAFISQNIYLFCASEGLATGVRASVDKPTLARSMQLADTQIITFAQSVGFPGK